MKAGTRIQVRGWTLTGAETWEAATIARTTANMLPLPKGYQPVRFADGGRLLVHSSRFRVTDNR